MKVTLSLLLIVYVAGKLTLLYSSTQFPINLKELKISQLKGISTTWYCQNSLRHMYRFILFVSLNKYSARNQSLSWFQGCVCI